MPSTSAGKFERRQNAYHDRRSESLKAQIFYLLKTGREKLSDKYKADPKLSFIIKAIYTMAFGLHHMHQDVCGRDAVGLCSDLFPFNGSLFKVSAFTYRGLFQSRIAYLNFC